MSKGDKGNTLRVNETLLKGDYLMSSNIRYRLILQDDGNLVLYNRNEHRPTWDSKTQGKAVARAIMQSDGNFVIYGYPNAIWATGTDGKPNSILVLQDDGNVVIYQGAVPVWASNTAGQ